MCGYCKLVPGDTLQSRIARCILFQVAEDATPGVYGGAVAIGGCCLAATMGDDVAEVASSGKLPSHTWRVRSVKRTSSSTDEHVEAASFFNWCFHSPLGDLEDG